MNTSDKEIKGRLAASGSWGEPLSLITGQETVEELREMIIAFAEACPTGQNHIFCPFRILSGLSYDSLTNLVRHISRESCVGLFEQELACRSRADAACRKGLATTC